MGFLGRNSKQETQERLDKLVEEVTRLLQDLEKSDDLPKEIARQHVETADVSCAEAIKRFSEQRFAVCASLIEKAEIHLHMSRIVQSSNEDDRLTTRFPPHSPHACLIDFGNSIADLKFSVEYTNATIPEEHRQTLITIVDLWWEACDALAKGYEAPSRRFAEVGLLLLNILVLSVNLEDEHGNAPVTVRKTFSNPLFSKITQFAEQLAQAYHADADGDDTPPQAKEHLTAAVRNLNSAMGNLLAHEDIAADTNIVAGALELKYVQRLVTQNLTKKPGPLPPKASPIDIKSLQRQLADQLAAGDDRKRAGKHGNFDQRKVVGEDSIIETYNRIFDLLTTSNLAPDVMKGVLANLQSAVRFIRQSQKQQSDPRFAEELCQQALDDLYAAHQLVFGPAATDL